MFIYFFCWDYFTTPAIPFRDQLWGGFPGTASYRLHDLMTVVLLGPGAQYPSGDCRDMVAAFHEVQGIVHNFAV